MSEIYREKVLSKVNEEENFHEVILRGARSHSHYVLRNAWGTKDFEDGKEYELVVAEVGTIPKPKKASTGTKTGSQKAAEKPEIEFEEEEVEIVEGSEDESKPEDNQE